MVKASFSTIQITCLVTKNVNFVLPSLSWIMAFVVRNQHWLSGSQHWNVEQLMDHLNFGCSQLLQCACQIVDAQLLAFGHDWWLFVSVQLILDWHNVVSPDSHLLASLLCWHLGCIFFNLSRCSASDNCLNALAKLLSLLVLALILLVSEPNAVEALLCAGFFLFFNSNTLSSKFVLVFLFPLWCFCWQGAETFLCHFLFLFF